MKTLILNKSNQNFIRAIMLLCILMFITNCSNEEFTEYIEEDTNAIIESKASVAIQNPGFESGKSAWGSESNYAISGDEYSGSNAAKVTSSSGKIEQTVSVSANTSYELTAWVDGDGKIAIGGQTVDFDTDEYTQVSVTFNSGSSTSVTILGTRDSGDVRFDDFALESSGPIVYTPEQHSELAGQTFRLENAGSQLWARITAGGDFQDLEMTTQSSTGTWPRWVVEEVNDGGDYYYRFKNVSSNRRFRPTSASDSDVNTGRTNWTGNWTQWMVISQGNGQYILKNKSTGTFLSAGGNSSGAIVQHVENLDGNNTLWSFKPIADDTPPTPPSGDDPSDILDFLDQWKITMPLDEDGLDSNTDSNTGTDCSDRNNDAHELTNITGEIPAPFSDYFFVSGDEVVFKAHCGGATTSGSNYTRSELRQRPGGGDNYWSMDDYQYLDVRVRATHLPVVKPEVSMVQIHGPSDEPLRVEYRADDQGLHITQNESTTVEYALPYSLGQQLHVIVTVDNGSISLFIENEDTGDTYEDSWDADDSTGYFKVGCYTQSSMFLSDCKSGEFDEDEDPDAYGEVRAKQLDLIVNY